MTTTTKSTKVAPKKAIKKVSPKKSLVPAKKSVAKKSGGAKTLAYADNGRSFWTRDGQILNSLLALYEVLASMEKAVYTHHVTKDRNDFAVWVEVVLGDKACAADLKKTKTPASARTVVAKHLKTYKI